MRILLVEDEPATRFLIERIISRQGYELVAADSGTLALSKLEECVFDLVVTDMTLPDIPGHQLVREIRCGNTRQERDLPIIVLSGKTKEQMIEECVGLNIQDFIEKPFTPQALRISIANLQL